MAYVVNSLNPGGTERLVIEMSCAFQSTFDISVVCLDRPGLWSGELRKRGVPVHCMWRQPGLDVGMIWKIAQYCRDRDVRVIHAHQCTPWFYAGLSRMINGRPRLLLEEHGRFFPEIRNRARELVNRALINRLTHSFVAVSQDIKSRLVAFEGIPPSRIAVVYNGVRAAPALAGHERAGLRAQLGFAPDSFVVGTVGRFDSIKNLPLLVRCLANVKRENPGLAGLLVGDGPEFATIEMQLASCSLSDCVRLTGFRADARALVQCMDLFVLPSFSEGTSVALLEAMAAGVPVVVTSVGGNPELVSDGVTGWVVPSNEEAAMSAAILAAWRDPKLRDAYARAARQRFVESFEFDAMIANYQEVYASLLDSAVRPALAG
ncbi:glycosyltransferase [Accumulibacter sp.]|uniref:glycosyltransferase n=1 Tax=Accumulibacter sp. TaxID=2053492 RepID=UPI002BB79B23|nr:glycosyltransferase [Accumulibacter sp.]HNB66621.1 glycosyltransferase [Accumulibacter sp.]